jgi:hypothetical protein
MTSDDAQSVVPARRHGAMEYSVAPVGLEQVLATETGAERLSSYPFEPAPLR